MVVAAFSFAAMGACIKILGRDLHGMQIAFFRAAFGLATIAPVVASQGIGILKTRRWRLHALRVSAGTAAMLCLFTAITLMPLATATAIAYARPLFVVVLAIPFLGEVVGWRRWAATIVGFAGVLIVLHPTADSLQPAALLAVLAAFLMGGVMICIKALSATERPVTMLVWFTIGSVAAALPFAIAVWQPPTWEHLAYGVAMGLLGTAGQYAVIRAFHVGEATAIAPFDYTQIAFAWAWGAFLLGDAVEAWTFVGAGVIVAANLYILHRETRRPPAGT
jgi:drug/metabolite transporter (DMT)-like permease